MPPSDPGKGPANERPTIHDVARLANVSPATVSKVLRGIDTVKPESVVRIRAAVKELGFRVDPLAANLRRAHRSIIGLVVPDFRNPFFGSLVAAFERLAEESGYRLVVVSTTERPEREAAQIEALLDWRVAGLILVPTMGSPAAHALIRDQKVATVLLDRAPDRTEFDAVVIDNFEASAAVMRHLIALGHRRIMVAHAPLEISNMRNRVDGVNAAAARAGLKGTLELVPCGFDVETAVPALASRFEKGDMPTAVFALFSPATLAILREVVRRNISLPDELSVIGFDDVEWMQVTHPPIAAVIQPIDEIARTAWRQLLARMANPAEPPRSFEVACRFDFRASVAPPR